MCRKRNLSTCSDAMAFPQGPRWERPGRAAPDGVLPPSRLVANRLRASGPTSPSCRRSTATAASQPRPLEPPSPDSMPRPRSRSPSPSLSRGGSALSPAGLDGALATKTGGQRKRSSSRATAKGSRKARRGVRLGSARASAGVVRCQQGQDSGRRLAENADAGAPRRTELPTLGAADDPASPSRPEHVRPGFSAAQGMIDVPGLSSWRSSGRATWLASPDVKPPPPRPSLGAEDSLAPLGTHASDACRPKLSAFGQRSEAAPRTYARAARLVRAAMTSRAASVWAGVSTAQLKSAAKAAKLRAPPSGRGGDGPGAVSCRRGIPSSQDAQVPASGLARPSPKTRAIARQLLWQCEEEDAAVEEARFLGLPPSPSGPPPQAPAQAARGRAAVRLAGASNAAPPLSCGGKRDAQPVSVPPRAQAAQAHEAGTLLFPVSEDEMIAALCRGRNACHGTDQELMVAALACAELRRQSKWPRRV